MKNETVKITLKKAALINTVGMDYLEKNNQEIRKDTWAVQRILNQTNSPDNFSEYNKKKGLHDLENNCIMIKHAKPESENSPKLLKDEEGNYIYSSESQQNVLKELQQEKENWNRIKEKELSKEITVNPYIVSSDVLANCDLTMEFIDLFDGIILDAEELYAKILEKPKRPIAKKEAENS